MLKWLINLFTRKRKKRFEMILVDRKTNKKYKVKSDTYSDIEKKINEVSKTFNISMFDFSGMGSILFDNKLYSTGTKNHTITAPYIPKSNFNLPTGATFQTASTIKDPDIDENGVFKKDKPKPFKELDLEELSNNFNKGLFNE